MREHEPSSHTALIVVPVSQLPPVFVSNTTQHKRTLTRTHQRTQTHTHTHNHTHKLTCTCSLPHTLTHAHSHTRTHTHTHTHTHAHAHAHTRTLTLTLTLIHSPRRALCPTGPASSRVGHRRCSLRCTTAPRTSAYTCKSRLNTGLSLFAFSSHFSLSLLVHARCVLLVPPLPYTLRFVLFSLSISSSSLYLACVVSLFLSSLSLLSTHSVLLFSSVFFSSAIPLRVSHSLRFFFSLLFFSSAIHLRASWLTSFWSSSSLSLPFRCYRFPPAVARNRMSI